MDVSSLPKVGPGLSAQPGLAQPLSGGQVSPVDRGNTAALGIVGSVGASSELHLDTRVHLEQVLRLDPAAAKPRVLLFLLELAEQRFAAAEPIIDALVREFPDEPEHLANYAELALRTLDIDKSRQLTARALQIDPKHIEARRVKVVLDVLSDGVTADARVSDDQASAARTLTKSVFGESAPKEGVLARFVEQRADASQVLFTLFQALVERQRFEEATRLGRELLRAQPHNAALDAALLDMRVLTHPLGAPLYPLRRGGWLGVAILGLLAVAFYQLLGQASDTLASGFRLACLTFLVYAAAYPTLMREWLREQTP